MRRTAGLLTALVLVSGCGAEREPAADVPTAEPTGNSSGDQAGERTQGEAGAPPEGPTQGPPAPPRGTRLVLAGSPVGRMLFDARGQAIYLFDVETTDEPRCYGACARAWPPVRTTGRPSAARGLDDRLVGTTRRRDGTLQVTYGGHPLYTYAHEAPGEVKCHDVVLNGGTWFAVGAEGERLP